MPGLSEVIRHAAEVVHAEKLLRDKKAAREYEIHR
jgi:hypothetical protein